MPVPFTCPHCGQQTFVDDQYVGQTGPCGRCGQTVTIGAQAVGPAPSGGGSAALVIGIVVAGVVLVLILGGIAVGVAVFFARDRAEIAATKAELRRMDAQMRTDTAKAQPMDAAWGDPAQGDVAERAERMLDGLGDVRLALPDEPDGEIPPAAPGYVRVHFKGPEACSITDLFPGGQTCPCRIDFRGNRRYEFNFASIPQHEGTAIWAMFQFYTPAVEEGSELEVVLPKEVLDAPAIGLGSLPRPVHFIVNADDPAKIEAELAPLPDDPEALAAHNQRFEEARDTGRLIAVLSLQKKTAAVGILGPDR
ncbi:MAG: hypothetical protein HYS13_06065 [Planctomycetia bacterium]|nr:hypothetical protein [Planctomycetia bacterium]